MTRGPLALLRTAHDLAPLQMLLQLYMYSCTHYVLVVPVAISVSPQGHTVKDSSPLLKPELGCFSTAGLGLPWNWTIASSACTSCFKLMQRKL